MSYREAGVDIEAGNALVEEIKPLTRATARPGSDAGLGGFGGLFDLKAAGFVDPILVAATDGVGTKLKIAHTVGRHDTVGIDLVAMCVNDLIVQGAEPLFFLDYFATGRLAPEAARDAVAGIAEGCKQAGCALIGGETAEMPGFYAPGEYDLAGFAVGAVERPAILPRSDQIAAGDKLLGLSSNGLHSNGFSLVRRVVEQAGLGLGDPAPFASDQTLSELLLTPTRIYVRACLDAIAAGGVKGLAHITGGGLIENLPRVLPDGLEARLDGGLWQAAPVFGWLAETAQIDPLEMHRTFNCGIGMVLVVAAESVPAVTAALTAAGETVVEIGELADARSAGPARIEIAQLAAPWRG